MNSDWFDTHVEVIGLSPEKNEKIKQAIKKKMTDDTKQCHCETPEKVTCGICDIAWCERCDPAPSSLCHVCHGRGYSTATLE